MSIFSRIRAALSSPDLLDDDLTPTERAMIGHERGAFPVVGPSNGNAGTWLQPPERGTLELLQAYAVSPVLRAVVQRVVQGTMLIKYWEHQAPDIKVFDSPIIELMNNYNHLLIGSKGRALEQKYLDVCGEVFVIKFPIAHRKKYELYPVPPTWVKIETHAGEREYIIRLGNHYYVFQDHEVIWRKDPDLVNPYSRGKGGAWAVADEIETDEYASKYAKSYFYNSAVPQFIASVKNSDGKPATETQARMLQRKFEAKHQGFMKSWAPNFTDLELDIHELTRKLGDDKIGEIRRGSMDIIRWLYGVPPEIIGMVDNSNRATIKEAEQIMGKFVITPRINDYTETWQHLVAPDFGNPVLAHSPTIPRTFDRRDEIMARHSYDFTRNEVRQEAGFDPVADGDVYLVPNGITPEEAKRNLADTSHKAPVIRIVE